MNPAAYSKSGSCATGHLVKKHLGKDVTCADCHGGYDAVSKLTEKRVKNPHAFVLPKNTDKVK